MFRPSYTNSDFEKFTATRAFKTLPVNYDRIKENISDANGALEEIDDKTYNLQTLDSLNVLKGKAEASASIYKQSVLSRIDPLIEDFRTDEQRISSMKVPAAEPTEINDKWKSVLRKSGMVILGIICFFFLLGFIPSMSPSYTVPVIGLLIFGTPLFLLFRAEKKWKAGLQQRNESAQLVVEQEFEENVQRERELLLKHPLHAAMQEIDTTYPAFNSSLSGLVILNNDFGKKWGV